MCEFNPKNGSRFIDPCLLQELGFMEMAGFRVVASCCGHGKYPKTIVIRRLSGEVVEFGSGVVIPRKKKFYRRDPEGVYYIPEVSDEVKWRAK